MHLRAVPELVMGEGGLQPYFFNGGRGSGRVCSIGVILFFMGGGVCKKCLPPSHF